MKQRGFTLLEVLVATAIMGIAVAGVLSALSSTVRNGARLTDYDRAVMLSRAKIDELLLEPRFPRNTVVQGAFDPSLMGGLQGGWTAVMTRFETPPSPQAGDQALDRLQLQVWWMSGGARRTFALEGYRATVIRPEELHP